MATTRSKKRKSLPEDPLERQKVLIQREIKRINKQLEPFEELIDKRNRLNAAMRALDGGSRLTGAGGTRLRQEDVVECLRKHPKGMTVQKMQKELGVESYQTIASHLYRGRDERFLQDEATKKWYLRDPEEGIDTIEDALEKAEEAS